MSIGGSEKRLENKSTTLPVPLLARVLFFVLTGVLCARPLIPESFHRAPLAFLPADVTDGTTPATTVWLDGILLVVAAVVWARYGRPRLRVGLTSAGLVLLLAALVVSVSAANDKRLAANAGAHLLVTALAGTALWRVTRARWMVHLLIAAVLASGVTNAVKCVMQRAYEFEESLQYWEEQKPARMAAGLDPRAPAVINYERRLRSNEAFGYLSHPNVTASCLAMCLLVSAGLLIGTLRKPAFDANRRIAAALVAAALAATLAVGQWLTGSTGAALALVPAGLVLIALGLLRSWVARHARCAFTLLAAGYIALLTAGAGYGLWKGTLPHTSLAFRWQYWRAAAHTVADAPLTGIGRENFRAAYLIHKSPESTEEVSNPHDLWISLLVELGPLGLLAGMLLILGAVFGVLRGLRETVPGSPMQPTAGLTNLTAAAVGVLLVQAVFSATQFGAPGIPLLWAVFVAGVWVVTFVAAHSLACELGNDANTAPWLIAGVGAALCASLIHNLIGFSLFTPAGLSVFVTLSVAAAAPSGPAPVVDQSRPPARRSTRSVPFSAALTLAILGVGAYAILIMRPTIRSEAALRRIRNAIRGAANPDEAWRVLENGRSALAADAWDAEVPQMLGQAAYQIGAHLDASDASRGSWLELAGRYVAEALRRNPRFHAAHRLRAEILEAQAARQTDEALLRRAAEEWEAAVELYPTDPRARLAAGNAWLLLWRRTGAPAAARYAVRHLEAALAIDATRLPEVAVKLRPAETQTIRAGLDELREAGFGAATSSPAASAPGGD